MNDQGSPDDLHAAGEDRQPGGWTGLSGLARTLLLGGAVALVAIVGAGVMVLLDDPGSAEQAVTVGDGGNQLEGRLAPTEQAPLPDRELDGFDGGEPVDLAAYRGAPVVVNFWASWCEPCVQEMPDFQEVAEDLTGRVPFLGVNVQDAPANAKAFVDELGITYDLAADPSGEFYRDVDAFGMPTTLLVDADGMIVYRHTGILDADGLRELVAERLDVEA